MGDGPQLPRGRAGAQLRRPEPFILRAWQNRLVVPSLGFSSAEVAYVRAERVAGETKYPLSKMVKLTLDSITSFSAAPLRIATWLGMLAFFICVALVIAGVVASGFGAVVPGWTSLYIAVLLLGGIQLICLGLLGEYIGRIYAATQNRPQFLIAFDTDNETVPSVEQVEELASHR